MISIRTAQSDDYTLIAQADAVARNDPWTISQIESELACNPAIHLIVEENSIPCGFALSRIILDELEIDIIAVVPSHRRQGLGTQLLQTLLHRAHIAAIKKIYLEVAAGNTAARALYTNAGFVEIDVRRNYYAHTGDDAVVLCYIVKPFI